MPVPTMRGVTIDAREAGLYRRYFRRDDSQKLYLPLWHPDLNGSPFLSKDLNAHLCTVYGATWGIQGRTFDGSNDYIYIQNHTALNFGTGPFSLILWGKFSATTIPRTILKKQGAGWNTGWELYMNAVGKIAFVYGDGSTAVSMSGTISHEDDLPVFITFTRDAAGNASLRTDLGDEVTGNGSQNVSTATAMEVMKQGWNSSGYGLGKIYEVFGSSCALSQSEILQIYLATKWRYQ